MSKYVVQIKEVANSLSWGRGARSPSRREFTSCSEPHSSLSRARGQGCGGKISKNKSFTCSFVLVFYEGLHREH